MTGIDGSNAKRNQELGIKILKNGLDKMGVLPKREFENVEEFKSYFSKENELIIDGIEQRMQRPSDNETQKEHYSGKKRDIL